MPLPNNYNEHWGLGNNLGDLGSLERKRFDQSFFQQTPNLKTPQDVRIDRLEERIEEIRRKVESEIMCKPVSQGLYQHVDVPTAEEIRKYGRKG